MGRHSEIGATDISTDDHDDWLLDDSAGGFVEEDRGLDYVYEMEREDGNATEG